MMGLCATLENNVKPNQLTDLDDDIVLNPEQEKEILEALEELEEDEFWLLDKEYEDRLEKED